MKEREVPGFEDYKVTIDGEIVSYKCGKRIIRKQPPNPRFKTSFRAPDNVRHGIRPYRLIASSTYGRWPTSNEVVRHKDGNPHNSHPLNLEFGDRILNAIDEYVYGDRETTLEYLDHAIDLLMGLREKMGG